MRGVRRDKPLVEDGMCFSNSRVKRLRRWNWGGERIIHESIVPSSRPVVIQQKGWYDINVRSFILAAAFSAALGFGTSASAQVHSYLVDLNSKTVTDIGTLGGTYLSTDARGINEAGQVAGSSGTTGGVTHAFITGPDGMGMRDLGTLGGAYSFAYGINDAGQVVGSLSDTAGGAPHAFITGPDGVGMRDLGDSGGFDSDASGINGTGQVAGFSFRDDEGYAFITGPDGLGMRHLGTLGGAYSSAQGINDAGQVVGNSGTAEGVTHAFITGPNGAGMMDLNSLVDVPRGVTLTQATGINNAGQVVAYATIPEPKIYALFLAGLALVGFIERRKKMGGKAFSLG
jgi:probable HAF family extracellular repeat protein